MKFLVIAFLMCVVKDKVQPLKLPGPRVYVVTPSPTIENKGRSANQPFYYHSWKRMDGPKNTTTVAPTTKTQDLIFAEFEADKTKNIRKLLEKERITLKPTTTTRKPIYVPEENVHEDDKTDYSSQPSENKEQISKDKDMSDYFAMYNNMYNHAAPVYIPTVPTTAVPESKDIAKPTTTTETPVNDAVNVWNIIDNEKHHQYSGGWDEVPVNSDDEENSKVNADGSIKPEDNRGSNLDEHFAIPGFGTNHGNGAENESRAIRTESDIRFPYVNLKPFQVKDMKKPTYGNSKKGNNMYTSLDNFREMKNPVRGEAQDVLPNQPIDRYNSAQPYLPKYGGNMKQSSPSQPGKTVSNLVPPPPPPPPKVTADDFPAPSSYESFPPYSPADDGPPLPSRPSYQPPMESGPRPPVYQPPADTDDSDDSGPPADDGPMDLGYRYKPPTPPNQNFLPTLPPLIKPGGYSYEKPVQDEAEPDDKPDFHGYHYNKPAPPKDHSYGHDDFPDLVFDKPHGSVKGGDDMKGDDMGMMPPPPQGPLADDSGFPSDFPVDFKYHHFDDHDHDFYHHHHHPTTTTTTTTTEQPRVNRYSYYYLGKKLYYLPLYFSVYFIIYVGALIIKAVLRHKIVYPNSWRPNDTTSSFFSKRSLDNLTEWKPTHDNLHEITGRVTRAISAAAEKYMNTKSKETQLIK